MEQRKGALQMALCAVMWSIAGVFIKQIPWNSMVIAGFRSLIAAGVLGLYMLCTKRRFAVSAASARLAALISATSFLFMAANKLTTAANAIVLQYTAPVFLLLYGVVFDKKRFRGADYAAVALTMAGVALFFFDQLSGGALLGNGLAVLAGACFAGTMDSVAKMDEDTRLSGLTQGHILTALIGMPLALVYGMELSGGAVSALLILGVVQMGLPYILYGLAASRCAPLALTLLAALEPILNPVWVYLAVGEAPGRTALLGGALVIVSVTAWCVWDAKQKRAEAIKA